MEDRLKLNRYPRRQEVEKDHGGKRKLRKNAKIDPSATTSLSEIYEGIEKRQFTAGEYGDYVDELYGLYSADALPCSIDAPPTYAEATDEDDVASEVENDGEDDDDEEGGGVKKLRLPKDGSIFINGLPFHHCVLTRLNEKHYKRLLKNGIEISRRRFSAAEDQQILKNWKEYANKYNILEEEAPAYLGCATKQESAADRRERLDFMQRTQFRPWMCKRMLNRTCAQVFRRCYHLFRDDRDWAQEDDELLMELHEKYDGSWEAISADMCRTRYSCRKRYEFLTSAEENRLHRQRKEWTNAELVRLYLYISQELDAHPVLVATEPKYAECESTMQWDPEKMDLPHKSVKQCQKKWEEIKGQLREARERLNTDVVEDVEKAVFPNSRLLCGWLARQQVRMRISCADLVKAIDALLAQCAELETPLAGRLSAVVDKKEFNKRLAKVIDIPFEVTNAGERVLRRIAYMLKVFQFYKIFDILPVQYSDSLEVKIRAIAHVLRRANTFQLKKRKLRKYVRHFVREQGWSPRPRVFLVDKDAKRSRPNTTNGTTANGTADEDREKDEDEAEEMEE